MSLFLETTMSRIGIALVLNVVEIREFLTKIYLSRVMMHYASFSPQSIVTQRNSLFKEISRYKKV